MSPTPSAQSQDDTLQGVQNMCVCALTKLENSSATCVNKVWKRESARTTEEKL